MRIFGQKLHQMFLMMRQDTTTTTRERIQRMTWSACFGSAGRIREHNTKKKQYISTYILLRRSHTHIKLVPECAPFARFPGGKGTQIRFGYSKILPTDIALGTALAWDKGTQYPGFSY